MQSGPATVWLLASLVLPVPRGPLRRVRRCSHTPQLAVVLASLGARFQPGPALNCPCLCLHLLSGPRWAHTLVSSSNFCLELQTFVPAYRVQRALSLGAPHLNPISLSFLRSLKPTSLPGLLSLLAELSHAINSLPDPQFYPQNSSGVQLPPTPPWPPPGSASFTSACGLPGLPVPIPSNLSPHSADRRLCLIHEPRSPGWVAGSSVD